MVVTLPVAPHATTARSPGALRVVHFTDTYLPRRDGIVTALRALTEALTAEGHQCLTVVPKHSEQVPDRSVLQLVSVPCGVADVRLLPWPTLRQVARIAAWNPDLVHVHTPLTIGLLGVLAARRLGVPVVHTYHTDVHAYADAYRVPASALRIALRLYARRLGVPAPDVARHRHAALDAGNRLLLHDADAIVVPTAAVLARVAFPVPASRLFLVPTGVAPHAADAAQGLAFRARYGIATTEPVVLFVGRVNREKGVDLLVRAFADLAGRHRAVRLVLVGAVYEPHWLRRMLDDTDIAGRVVVTGQLDAAEVAEAYQAADVFAFPSCTDTQGLVLQEAALAGVPSVLVDPVLYRMGVLGDATVLADPDPVAYGAAIGWLLDDPVAARTIGAAARERALRHTPRQYMAETLKVYDEVLANRRCRATGPGPYG